MKKLFFTTLLMVTSLSFSQKFEVIPTGLKDSDDKSKSFLIIQAEGKTANELYNEAIKYINKNYKNPEEVIKGNVNGEYLRFNTYAPNFIVLNNSGAKIPFNTKYTTELSFKDGRVKYEIINLEIVNDSKYNLNFTGGGLSYFIYNKKGELKREKEKESIESYFNQNIENLKNSLSGKSNDDNW